MGRDKATIEIGGIALLRRVYNAIAPLCDRVYVVTPWIDRYRDLLPIDCNWILETSIDGGPLAGFAQVLPAIESEWVLLSACDLPNLSTELWQSQIPNLAKLSPETIAYLPTDIDGEWEPLAGFYRTDCRREIDRYLHTGRRSVRGWLDRQTVAEMPIEGRDRYLFNCNTPADLDLLVNRSHGAPP
jgi:molybdenum cofactor guanylyltransferase